MLKYGTIISTQGHKAKVQIPEMDNFETNWLEVPQLCTVGDKSSNIYEIGTEVGVVLSENFDDGCIIGALYNDEDIAVSSDKNIKNIVFSDGSVIEYNKQSHTFTLNLKGVANITATVVNITGDLNVSGNIKSGANVSDSKGSMQDMRDIYNSHSHGNGHNGANTSGPDENI